MHHGVSYGPKDFLHKIHSIFKICLHHADLIQIQAVAQYEDTILRHLDRLDHCVEADARSQTTSDVWNLFYWFGFDSMGDFAFNKSFGMLQNRQWHHIIVLLQRALSLLGILSPMPWIIQIGFKLAPRVGTLKDWFTMTAWCEQQMRERIEVSTQRKGKWKVNC